MPIAFACACGKTLQVSDELAGRQVKCPSCNGVAVAPTQQPAFEVIADATAPLVPPQAPQAAPRGRAIDPSGPAEGQFQRSKEAPSSGKGGFELTGGEGDRPKEKRPTPNDEGDRPRKDGEKPKHFGLERKVLSGGVAGGLLAMVIAVVWFVAGLAADRIFFYPPVLFVLGLVAAAKGVAAGGGEE